MTPTLRLSRIAQVAGMTLVVLATLAGCERTPEAPAPAPVAAAPAAPVEQTPIAAKGPQSAEARVLALLAGAQNLRVLALEAPRGPVPEPPKSLDCRVVACIERHPIVGMVAAGSVESRTQIDGVLRDWFAGSLQATRECTPVYRHAVAFVAEGGEYLVLLDYACGRYQIIADGRAASLGGVSKPGGLAVLHDLLRAGGVEGYIPPGQ